VNAMGQVEIKNLTFGYNAGDNILNNVNVKVYDNDFMCIFGENGSGKSTLMKCILGLNKGYTGEIKTDEKISYLPQMTEIQNNFPASIEEVVLSGTIPNNVRKVWYTKKDKENAKNTMQELGIYEMRKRCFRELSGGQKQRVLIARALCMDTKTLILDEPVNGLDPTISHQIYTTLNRLNKEKGMTIIMVSHDIDRALEYCHRVVEIKDGTVVFNDIASKYLVQGGKKND